MSRETHIVGFRVGRETYGVPITSLHEIVRVPEITAVPDSPTYIEGVINLRGKIIPVVDLRKRFSEDAVPHRRNRIMVAELDGHLVGLVVDAANEVLKVDPSLIEPPPNVFEQGEVNYVTGVGKLEGKLVILIDLAKIMQRGELRRISELSETADAIPPAK